MNKKISTTVFDNGFIEPKIIEGKHYIEGSERSIEKKLGSLGIQDDIIKPDGQWNDGLPSVDEAQVKSYDTFGCTIFNTTNQTEIYEKSVFGTQPNYSDRLLYNMVGINPPGADPEDVYETVRLKGLADESVLPWSDDVDTLQEYSQPRPVPQTLLGAAKRWLDNRTFKHSYLKRGTDGLVNVSDILEWLKKSPLSVAVQAWSFDGEKYVRTGADIHWTTLYGSYENSDFKCLDSYPPFLKRIDKNFGFRWVKRIAIKNTPTPKELSILQQIVNALSGIVDVFSELVRRATAKQSPAPQVIDSVPVEEIPKPDLPPEPGPEPVPPPVPVRNFALAIQRYEGYYAGSRSYVNRNPGNLRYTSLTAQLGATGKDDKGFCIFEKYEDGLWALSRFIVLAKQNKLKSYKDCTIRSFFSVYAPTGDNNNPSLYARTVASWLKVPVDSRLADILV